MPSWRWLPVALATLLAACGAPAGASIHYLALGDSYTIGTGAGAAGSFPARLARKLEEASGQRVAVTNLGVNGYTARDLIEAELPRARRARPDLVTVLIGANDIVRGEDERVYRDALREIYNAVRELALPAERVRVISIPDFSVVPAGRSFGAPAQLRQRIDAFNRIAQEEAGAFGFAYIDISAVSREGIARGDWVAFDGLHPAPAQYQAWADRIWELVRADWSRVPARD